MLGVQACCQRVVGNQAFGGVCAFQTAEFNAFIGGKRRADGQLDVLQQRQIRRAGGDIRILAQGFRQRGSLVLQPAAPQL